ncbi:calmodulin binding protein, putative [Ricinus communis]|uniref:Calmodulin binding protein, putative n=1 Tax=Ricinus communis TaxID=3988 RepID=B9S9J5_RICCO|nr:calmodulin binding protein, putative [Ricinus communis]|eukprot:XP_002522664.1 auxin-responsive protein SAUR68 [Ricinus communis]
MISAKKLLKLARKWQKLAAIKRKRITLSGTIDNTETSSCSPSQTAKKGHFVVYSADQKRFLLPLEYLNKEMFRELFNMAEEEFGSQSNGPLTLPCDAELMEYAISLIKQQVTREVENAFLMSISSGCSWSSCVQEQVNRHQLPILSF